MSSVVQYMCAGTGLPVPVYNNLLGPLLTYLDPVSQKEPY